MKQLAKALRSRFLPVFQRLIQRVTISRTKEVVWGEPAADEVLEEPLVSQEKQPENEIKRKGILEKIAQKLLLRYRKHAAKAPIVNKASLFSDSGTAPAALSLVMRGLAEVLSQKMDLPWKADPEGVLSYQKQVQGGKGKIWYYVTDSPANLDPLAEEAALTVIDQFDPRAGAIHLIYCAQVAALNKPWEDDFLIDDRQLLEYTGLVKRRDLCRHKQLKILYDLLRQPAQILAYITWPKQGKIGAFTVADLQLWHITVLRDFETDKVGDQRLSSLRVIGKPGLWTKYFLDKSEYYYQTGLITKQTIQKLFSIGKQNVGAARILIWLPFQIKPGFQDRLMGKTLMEIAYGSVRVAAAKQDRQLRRQLADDFETDLKALKEAGWQLELESGPAWLTNNDGNKRPIGFWSQILSARWRFHLPKEVQERLSLPECQQAIIKPKKKKRQHQPLPGPLIREARKAKGWSRAFFAATMGKSVSWVDAIETGHRQVSEQDLPKLINKLKLHKISDQSAAVEPD